MRNLAARLFTSSHPHLFTSFRPVICAQIAIFVGRFFKLEKVQTHPFLLRAYRCYVAGGVGDLCIPF